MELERERRFVLLPRSPCSTTSGVGFMFAADGSRAGTCSQAKSTGDAEGVEERARRELVSKARRIMPLWNYIPSEISLPDTTSRLQRGCKAKYALHTGKARSNCEEPLDENCLQKKLLYCFIFF